MSHHNICFCGEIKILLLQPIIEVSWCYVGLVEKKTINTYLVEKNLLIWMNDKR